MPDDTPAAPDVRPPSKFEAWRNALAITGLGAILLGLGCFVFLGRYLPQRMDLFQAAAWMQVGFAAGLAVIVAVIVAWQRARGSSLAELGWRRPTTTTALVLGVLMGVGYLWGSYFGARYLLRGVDVTEFNWVRVALAPVRRSQMCGARTRAIGGGCDCSVIGCVVGFLPVLERACQDVRRLTRADRRWVLDRAPCGPVGRPGGLPFPGEWSAMLVRFCTLRRHAVSHSPEGVFQAALELRDDGRLEAYEEEWLERELRWLRMHLPSPDCLRDDGNERAICWFKPDAKRAIEKVRGIVALLQAKGIPVEMVTTADAGTIIYEDKWQVVAKPRRKRAAGVDRGKP